MLLKRAVDCHNEFPAQLARHCRILDCDLENMPEKPPGGNPLVRLLRTHRKAIARGGSTKHIAPWTIGPIDQDNLMEKWLIDQGNLMSSKAQIRTLLEEQRQMIIAEYREKVGHHELQAAQAKEERRLLQGQLWQRNWNFVKLINEVLQGWKNYGNFIVLHSILWQDEDSSRIRTLFWNSRAECRNCKMK